MKDRDVRFHEEWLGLAQPIEGLVFSVPVLADAQITPDVRPALSTALEAHLAGDPDAPRLRSTRAFFTDFLGYDQPGTLVSRAELPESLSFYAPEGGQEIRPSYALARGPFESADPFAGFEDDRPATVSAAPPGEKPGDRYFALVWDVGDDARAATLPDLDAPEDATGPWRYPPTAKFERLLRHAEIPVGLISNGSELRLVYAPAGETTGHLTFRMKDLSDRAGRPVLAALELLLHARRAYGASEQHTLEGLLRESRRRQADVTKDLAEQVFEGVEILLAGFEQAARRDCVGDRIDWLRAAIEEPGEHFYQGVLSVVLRLVFVLYSEDAGLLPTDNELYAQHLSLFGLYDRLSHDAGAHPESMHHRFGAYGQLLCLFRAVFLGVGHGKLELPQRRGKLFDPNTYPFLEGGLPGWTAAINDPAARAKVQLPSIDDGTIYRVLHRLVVFEGQRLSYRALDVEQIGSVYESLMGYDVKRLVSPAARIGKNKVWVETETMRQMSATDRKRLFKEVCGLNPGPIASLEAALKEAGKDETAELEALLTQAPGTKAERERHRALTGRLVLQPSEERRRTGSHYTPRSLTESMVERTLEPLLATLGPERTAEQLMQLKICDPAMGSGAFLVAACRQLATEVVRAWTRSGEVAAIAEQYGDPYLHARRLVAQRCLYGVDKNPAAVELAKLSLWLVTLSKTLPFTFVDHALRAGDSLVGLDFEQIKAFHWKPGQQLSFCEHALSEALEQAIALRQEILELAKSEDPAAQAEKRRLLEFAQQAIDRVRLVADVCIGAFFSQSKDKAREKERLRRQELVERYLAGDEHAHAQLVALGDELRQTVTPFHWWIEFPEVFFEERPDPLQGGAVNGAALMEAVVGNPPFMGQARISGQLGREYAQWLFSQHSGAVGKCDLAAHFFRRAEALLGAHGTFGLVATNTISQGDTRESGLARLVRTGWRLYSGINSLPWPGQAAVTVSIVHGAKGYPSGEVRPSLDGVEVESIDSRLKPCEERGEAARLECNARLAYLGCKVGGQGFVLSSDQAASLCEDARNADRIFRYVGGEDVNTHPRQESARFVIDFAQLPLEEARTWPRLLEHVEKHVRPYRLSVRRESWRKYWWRFAEVYPAMRATIAPLKRCLVTARVSSHLVLSFQPSDRVYSEQLYVFPLERFCGFATLQSRVHEVWARLLSSSMKTDLRYTASDCFDTFPFPRPDPRAVIPALEDIGERLYETRARFMVDTEQGLTKTYNALKDPNCTDPRVLELRDLHEQMDRAVLDAYGWPDIEVPPYCPIADAHREALQAFEDEVIDRLYVLNAERAREEQRQEAAGVRSPVGKGSRPKPAKPRGKKKPAGQGELF